MTAQTTLPCPHCNKRNRVPSDRLADAPQCGSCGKPLFAGQPAALDVDHFYTHANADLPLLIDFWAPWCGPCQMMAPEFEAAAAELEPQMRLAKVDTQSQPTLGQQYNVRSIPTMVLLHQGRELARRSGAMRRGEIVAWARQALSSVD